MAGRQRAMAGRQRVKERPFRASDKEISLLWGVKGSPKKGQKYGRDSYTFRSVSRRLLGVERGACTFFQPFYTITSEGIPANLDERSFAYFFLKKNIGFRRSEGSLFNRFQKKIPAGLENFWRAVSLQLLDGFWILAAQMKRKDAYVTNKRKNGCFHCQKTFIFGKTSSDIASKRPG